MGLNTIPDRANGDTIDQTWFNLLKSVLTGDFVPRNVSGVIQAVAGSLGTTTIPWLKMCFGLAASKLSLEDDGSGNAVFKNNGATILKVNKFGTFGLSIAPNKVTISASGNWTVPNGVTRVIVEACGGGGGGGRALVGSASGGSGSVATMTIIDGLTDGQIIPIVIGAGGAGGGATAGDGGDTLFNAMTMATGGKAGAENTSTTTRFGPANTAGGGGGGNGPGQQSAKFAGGLAGTGGGGGGGGASDYGTGGNGGGLNTVGSDGNGPGAGGGGAGFNSNGGGAGKDGQIIIYW